MLLKVKQMCKVTEVEARKDYGGGDDKDRWMDGRTDGIDRQDR